MHLDLLWFDQQDDRVAGGLGEGAHKTRVVLHLRPLHEGRAGGPLATPSVALQGNCKDFVSLCQSIVGCGDKGLACTCVHVVNKQYKLSCHYDLKMVTY